jgi:hypothetical protein
MRARRRIRGAAAHNGPRRIEDRPSASRRGGAPPAESGAYPVQRRDRGGVPRADVRVERSLILRVERLRAN